MPYTLVNAQYSKPRSIEIHSLCIVMKVVGWGEGVSKWV
jgi:hypothetical protein